MRVLCEERGEALAVATSTMYSQTSVSGKPPFIYMHPFMCSSAAA